MLVSQVVKDCCRCSRTAAWAVVVPTVTWHSSIISPSPVTLTQLLSIMSSSSSVLIQDWCGHGLTVHSESSCIICPVAESTHVYLSADETCSSTEQLTLSPDVTVDSLDGLMTTVNGFSEQPNTNNKEMYNNHTLAESVGILLHFRPHQCTRLWPVGSTIATVCSPTRRQSGQPSLNKSSAQLRVWLPTLGSLTEGWREFYTTTSTGWICHGVCYWRSV